MARLVVTRTDTTPEELWVLTDDDNRSTPAEALEWQGRKVAIHSPTPADFNRWQILLQQHQLAARCPSCRNRLYVKSARRVDNDGSNYGGLGWHWHHFRRGESCPNTSGETARHHELKARGAEIAAHCGLDVRVEHHLGDMVIDVHAVAPDGWSCAYEPEVSGHRSAGELLVDDERHRTRTHMTLWDMSPSAYRPQLDSVVAQALRHGDRFVDGIYLLSDPDQPVSLHAESAIEAGFTRRLIATDGKLLLTNTRGVEFKNGRRKSKPVSLANLAAVAPLRTWHQHSQPNSEPPGPPHPGQSTPSPSTATYSQPSTTSTPSTLFAEPSKNSPPHPPSPGSDKQHSPTGTAATPPTPTAGTAAKPTWSPPAPNSSNGNPVSTRPANEAQRSSSTPSLFSPQDPRSRTTTTSTAPANAPSANGTTSTGTPCKAELPGTAHDATNCPGHGVATPPVRCVESGDLHFDCPRCADDVFERYYGPCELCRKELRMGLPPRFLAR